MIGMIDLALFVIVAILAGVFSAMIFAFKDILHAALALAGVFLMNSLLFIMLQQPLLAVVQLFILVGGVTTFLFVGVASATYSQFKYTRVVGLIVLWAIVFGLIIIPFTPVSITSTNQNLFTSGSIGASLSSSAPIFYVMLLVLFGVALGAIALLKKVSGVQK